MPGRLLSAVVRGWEWAPAGGPKRHLLFLIPAACAVAVVVYVGAVRTHACGHDIMHFLEAAWRVLNGQRPHADFYSPLGPLTYLVMAAGLTLSGLRVEGIGYGAALFGAGAGVWAYRLALGRMHLVPAALTGCFVILLSAAPVPLGAGPPSLSHAMVYNRFGFALIAIVLLEVMEAPARSGKRDWMAGLSTGAACALLLLLKASYFLVAVVLTLVFSVVRRRSLRGWTGFAVGAGLVLLAALVWLRFDVDALFADQLLAGAARSQRLTLHGVAILANRSMGELVLLLVVAALGSEWGSLRGVSQWKWLLAAPAVFGSGILLMGTNAQDAGLPLSAVLLLLMAGSVRQPGTIAPGRAACVLGATLLVAANMSLDAASLMAAVRQKHSPPSGAQRLLPPHMSGLLLYDLGGADYPLAYSNGPRYVNYVNQGIRLLEAQSSPRESVATLEEYNPFSYVLLRKPGAGGFTFLAYQYSFSERSKPSVERLFGGVDIVMVPKRNLSDPGQYRAILSTYLPGIQRMFTLAAENPEWWMYRRRR